MSYILRDYQGASHPSSISTFNCCSIFQRFLFDKKINNFADLKFVFVDYRNFTKIKKIETIYCYSEHPYEVPQKVTFIGYKQTNTQTRNVYIFVTNILINAW